MDDFWGVSKNDEDMERLNDHVSELEEDIVAAGRAASDE
jgi:hypothetical protein